MFPNRLAEVFQAQRDRPALWWDGQHTTYGQLWSMAGGIAQQLEAERTVAIVDRRDARTYASILACWITGRCYLPIHPDHPEQRNTQLMQQANVGLVLDSQKDLVADAPLEQAVAEPAAIAYILFTSGSTGTPKGVPISYANLDAFVQAFNGLGFDVGPDDRWLQQADLTFDLSVMSLLPAWLSGGCAYLPGGEGPKYMAVLELAQSQQLTVLPTVPSVLSLLSPFAEEIDLPEVRYAFVGAEAFPESLANQWMQCLPNAQLYNFYGPTEGTILSSVLPVQREAENAHVNGILSIGKPVPGMNIAILDDDGQPADEGELCIAGPQVFSGYLTEPAYFLDHEDHKFYMTGDCVRLTPEGNLLFLGRMDDQVQVQGHRVELGEIHAAARKLTDARILATTEEDDTFQGTRVILYVVSTDRLPDDFRSKLAALLPPHMMPHEIRTVEKL